MDQRFVDQARDLITETIKQVVPQANVDGGSAINAVLARGAAAITGTVLQELEHTQSSRNLSQDLSQQDLDLMLENLLVERDAGDLAQGFVNLYYADRNQRQFGAGLMATTEEQDIRFVTMAEFTFQPQDYYLDPDTGWYYIPVPFVAEKAGTEYNVDVGTINQLLGDSSAPLLVSNPAAFLNGKPEQTNEEALAMASTAVSTRTPISVDGNLYWLQKKFGGKLRNTVIVGAGSPAMLRDQVYDLGEGQVPRFRIGVAGLDAETREQLGTSTGIHVGGRTDVYLLFDSINYVQQHFDIFADMKLNSQIPIGTTTIVATFIPGTTGQVLESGKIILDLGQAGEEVVYYSGATTPDQNTYTFTLTSPTVNAHAAASGAKVVNNGSLSVGDDVEVRPVFKIESIRTLDPLTLAPMGEPIPETTPESRWPGWYVTKQNVYDLLSARETKTIYLDEKRDVVGNQAQSGDGGEIASHVIGSQTYTLYTNVGADFTNCQSRQITVGLNTRTIIRVLSQTSVVLSGPLIPAQSGVSFSIDRAWADYIENPIRLSYYTNTEIGQAQDFYDQDSQRAVPGDTLARMYLPVFLDFTLAYKGSGTTAQVRDAILEMFKSSSMRFEYSDIINAAYDGGADYVTTPFQVRVKRLQTDGSEITQYLNPDTETVNNLAVRVAPTVDYRETGAFNSSMNPNRFTASDYSFVGGDVGKMIWIQGQGNYVISAVLGGAAILQGQVSGTESGVPWALGATFLETRRPTTVAEFAIPGQGKLWLGGFSDRQECVEYESVAMFGDQQTFVLSPGEIIHFPHIVDEGLRVSTLDYDQGLEITDGVISDDEVHRPFAGQMVIEQLS